jgi:transposase
VAGHAGVLPELEHRFDAPSQMAMVLVGTAAASRAANFSQEPSRDQSLYHLFAQITPHLPAPPRRGPKGMAITTRVPVSLLVAIVVVSAATSDNTGGIATADLARHRSSRLRKLWCDGGFKSTFIDHCRNHHLAVEVVSKIHPGVFEVLPRRWVVERTWSWLMNNRRLQIDHERDPDVHAGFVWAAHSRHLLRRLDNPPQPTP